MSNDPAATEIYTLSLHDALPISRRSWTRLRRGPGHATAGNLGMGSRRSRRALGTPEGRRARTEPLANEDTQRRPRSEEHTSELQSQSNLVCRLLLEKKNYAETGR